MNALKQTFFVYILTTLMSTTLLLERADGDLSIKTDQTKESLSVYTNGLDIALLTQNAKEGFRPYMHPVKDAKGKGNLTQFSPGHHKHQTGLYWGMTRVNGRDYFHNPSSDHWKRKAVNVIQEKGESVKWQTIYDMLDKDGKSQMTETQSWTMSMTKNKEIILDLEWEGLANKTITVSKYNYGGLFLRMPWKRGVSAETINSKGDKNQSGEGKSANWVDIGMQIENLDQYGRIVIYDHPNNAGYPNLWRIDGQFGIGPAISRKGTWSIENGKTKKFKHRFLIYSGGHDETLVNNEWKKWSHQK